MICLTENKELILYIEDNCPSGNFDLREKGKLRIWRTRKRYGENRPNLSARYKLESVVYAFNGLTL